MAACIPASLAGARVFTATASQGLLLMHELLHYAAGARAPIVMANVNRTVASPWAFWPDQTDSLAQRDTGWIQFYVRVAQESLDTVMQAFRIAEGVSLPVMVNLDAFYVSHALEPVLGAGAGAGRRLPAALRAAHRLIPAWPSPGATSSRRTCTTGTARTWTPRWRVCRRWPRGRPRLGASAPAAAGAAPRALPLRRRADGDRHDGQHVRHRARGGRRAARGRARRSACSRCGCSGRCRCRRCARRWPACGRDRARPQPLARRGRRAAPGTARGALRHAGRAARARLLAGVGGVNVPPERIVEFVRRARVDEPQVESVWEQHEPDDQSLRLERSRDAVLRPRRLPRLHRRAVGCATCWPNSGRTRWR
jgi:hypothetical protein